MKFKSPYATLLERFDSNPNKHRHLRSIFFSGELEREAVCANFAHTAVDGKTYQVEYYSLNQQRFEKNAELEVTLALVKKVAVGAAPTAKTLRKG